MAAAQPKRSRARVSRATVQTIDEIERRIVEVREAENEALTVLVHAMREIAVRLPTDSKLPMYLAQHAKDIETSVRLLGNHHSQATAASNQLHSLVDDLVDAEILPVE